MFKKLFEDKYFALLLLILLITFILRVPSLYEPFWHRDEGIYFFISNGLNKGLTLYRDLFEVSFPAKYFLLAFWLKLFGLTIWSAKILLSYWIILTQVALFVLGKKLFDQKIGLLAALIYGILTALPILDGNIFNNELLWLLPSTLGLLAYLYERQVSSGILFGLAFLFKLPAIFDFFSLLFFLTYKDNLWHLLKELKKLRLYLLGFISPLLLTLTYFASSGNLHYFIDATISRNISYSATYNKLFTNYDFLILKFFSFALILIILRRFTSLFKSQNKLNLVIFWFLFSIFSSTLSSRDYFHYLIQALPSFSLIISFFIFRREKRRFLLLIVLVSLGLIYLAGVRSIFKANPFSTFNYYQNFFAYLKGGLTQADYNNSFDTKVNRNYDLSTIIKQKTNPNDRIFIWGDEPVVYALSNRVGATRFGVAYHILESPSYQAEVISKLTASPPKLILVEKDYSPLLPGLEKILSSKYNLIGVVENVTIYKVI